MTSPDELLAGLDEQQRQAAEALLGPVVLLAGAGTGKTRAITHRIAYGVATGVYSPSRVMALTFTARAAGELRSRLRLLGAGGVSARTFHASALSQLGFFWPQVVGGSAPKLLESKGRMIGHAAESLRLKLDTATLRDTAAEIEWRKVSRLTLEQYAAVKRPLPPTLDVAKVVDLQRAYETVKDDRKQLDFEDVLLVTAGMIESEPRVAQQVREQYRFFVVDEYQDVSPLQQELLSLWLGERNDVCVVGDASQTIYTFAGATPDYLLGFTGAHDDATVIRLEQNYRSTSAIVDAANRVMHGRAGALDLHAAPGASSGPAPAVSAFPHDRAEARAIAEAIRSEIDAGIQPASIAILYRINVQSAALETALGDTGVPFVIRGATRFFDQREVKEAIMLLKGASVNTLPAPLFQTVSDVLRSLGWTQDAPDVRGAVRDRWESLNALIGLADESPDGTTLKEFVAELLERQAGQHEPTMSAVTLATLHSAKGLEWDSVYIAGVSEGLLPIGYAKTEPAVEEERRLFYVGITRARRQLRLSWAGPNREASRFLADLR
ncbi:MAG TPA: ATP-dependent helicase [Galbitalea sp.]|nr:ATP-dependent helicase [Galbitalea sp.]